MSMCVARILAQIHGVLTYWHFHAGLDFFLKSGREKLEMNKKTSNQEYETASTYEMKFTDTSWLWDKHTWAITQSFS